MADLHYGKLRAALVGGLVEVQQQAETSSVENWECDFLAVVGA